MIDIYSLVKINFEKYDHKYKNKINNIIESLKKEIDIQKDQLDFMITKIFDLDKNYKREVKYMKHIGTEVYKKYPERIKLLENALFEIENKNNQLKEQDKIILNQNALVKILIIFYAILYFTYKF